jgi:predicted nucleic acid-binding protein
MTLYIDASAFVKRYARHEAHHDECLRTMDDHDLWVTSRITSIEAPRGIARASSSDPAALAEYDADAIDLAYIDIDHGVVAVARAIALDTGIKTLDAIHIASAKQLPVDELEFLTYDDRQAAAAESLGLRLAR